MIARVFCFLVLLFFASCIEGRIDSHVTVENVWLGPQACEVVRELSLVEVDEWQPDDVTNCDGFKQFYQGHDLACLEDCQGRHDYCTPHYYCDEADVCQERALVGECSDDWQCVEGLCACGVCVNVAQLLEILF